MDAERIDVLHRAHRDARVVGVAHDLVLDLLPADEAALDHDLADRARAQAGPDDLAVGGLGLDDAAAGAAERVGRPDDRRQADRVERHLRRVLALLGRGALDDEAGRVRLVDPVEQVAERLAVLGHVDGLERRAEQADRVALEDAGLGEGRREVEGRLAAQPGEQALGLLPGDHRLDRLDGQRLEIDRVGDGRVGHDRGRVRVDEDRADALGPQRAAGLRPGVVELGRLPDDDGPAAEDQDGGGLGAGGVTARRPQPYRARPTRPRPSRPRPSRARPSSHGRPDHGRASQPADRAPILANVHRVHLAAGSAAQFDPIEPSELRADLIHARHGRTGLPHDPPSRARVQPLHIWQGPRRSPHAHVPVSGQNGIG